MEPLHLSDTDLYKGLPQADAAALEAVYERFRLPVIRAISVLGGSEAAGKAFFQAGVIELATQVKGDNLTEETDFFTALKTYSLAHFAGWLEEKGQEATDITKAFEEGEAPIDIPDQDALRNTRQLIDSWKKGEAREDWRYGIWEKSKQLELMTEEGPAQAPQSNFARNLLIFFVLLTLAYAAYIFLNRSMTPAEVYDDNFTPPESLIADLSTRYGPERGNDSVTARPNACEHYFREADEFYKAGDYESARATLFQVLDDSLSACHSDALFYIGVMALGQDQPALALECFAKIEDLEHFGEDIYWYQALAIVKLAEINPLLKEKARRAVERARSNAQDPERRRKAEKMLKNLGK
ncbi:MAG: hypothetical protein KDC65_02190 [Saprospiraceae bacterium]|nr:hypothetical protein [Saprospiraceae bacterium]